MTATDTARMAEGAVFLLTGPSAAGKTTVSRLLAMRFTRAACLEGDVFRRSIVSGRKEMAPDPSVEAVAQLRLRYRLASAAVDTYHAAGFTVVLEDVVAGQLLSECIDLIQSRPLHVVVLMPSLEAVVEREAARGTVGYTQFSVEELHRGFADETPRVGLWVDSSSLTPERTVEEILARADQSLVVS